MNKHTIAVILGAIVIFAVALTGALAFTGTGSDAGNVHMMPRAQMMTGATDGSMMNHMMSDGQTMTGPMHTMSGGEHMPGMTHMSP